MTVSVSDEASLMTIGLGFNLVTGDDIRSLRNDDIKEVSTIFTTFISLNIFLLEI